MALSGHGYGAPALADGLLADTLDRAVPAAMAALTDLPDDGRRKQMAQWRDGAADQLAGFGDVVRYGGHSVADTFAILARGLAVLASAPGGVTAFGRHWCTDHAACEQAAHVAARTLAAEAA